MSKFFEGCVEQAVEITGIPRDIILGNSKEQRVVSARWFLIHLLSRMGFGVKEIGILIGKDHSTIINAKKKVAEVLENPAYNLVLAEHFKTLSE